mmetsp:Transcript_32341/g.44425  ORF Transcript_32341/g.44425 Transcript_32341/m.44425 type:complete len:221 (+) Transcript_32341:205-867(+)|eukprot:CAMPEP_0201490614 /NCGR_PEP_ID=MMETSP0151_2-20130828/26731_1 /ASSEMBLY_ACC=CAM_ASM_000257 /TAXON_ID=200890 /ORGANISM="Paramoeba atlantica, Strain 621/1 / CCAP 1560/9" /LENGTH=220 /DNA_ID=CAMNT_0047876625 /DNA_START=205 /DNA_END=867 /DNA_ORIENTATION=+
MAAEQKGKCSICLGKYSEESKGEIGECQHSFCYECISQWVMKASDRTCPLCKTNFTTIVHFEKGEKKEERIDDLSLPQIVPDFEDDSNIDSLDHSFCLGETERVMEMVLQEKRRLLESARPSNSQFSSRPRFYGMTEQRFYEQLEQSAKELVEMKEYLLLGEHFDSVEILKDLHYYQELVLSKGQGLGYEESEYYEEDEEEDYYDAPPVYYSSNGKKRRK